MRHASVLTLALGLIAAGAAHAAERSFMATGFEAIEVAGPYDVTVLVGKGPSVRATGDQADLDRLKVEVRGRRLFIGSKEERHWGKWSGKPVQLTVTTPALNAAALAGSGDMRIDHIRGPRFVASLGGSGNLSIAAVDAPDVKLSIAGSGDITVTGRCRAARMSIAGAGDVHAGDLRCETLTADIAGSGNIAAQATKTATVSVLGSGDVIVAGGAKCTVSKMGSGTVRCDNS